MLVGTRSFGNESARQSPSGSKSQTRRLQSKHKLLSDQHKPFGWRPANFTVTTLPHSPSAPAKKHVSVSANTHHDASASAPPITTSTPAVTMPRPIAPSSRSRSRASRNDVRHDPSAISPSVAALLAMTSIPKRKKSASVSRPRASPSRMTAQELREEWLRIDQSLSATTSSSLSPALDALLSPPEEEGDSFLASGSPDEHDTRFRPSRSASSDSMPSLEQDDNSLHSWTPGTPRSIGGSVRGRSERKEKMVSSPETIDDLLQHPLSLESVSPIASKDLEDLFVLKSRTSSPTPAPTYQTKSPAARLSSWKSNLTASLEAVRKAAISFSNFAAPSILPDDHITRGFTGAAPWRSEMRPRQLPDSPTPAMRRYFSPGSRFIPPARDFHMHDSHLDHTDLEAAAFVVEGIDSESVPPGAVIAMQDYLVSEAQPAASSDKRSTFTTEAGRALQESQQRREPRENNEFLRICVLEMNMRRCGKMEGPLGVGPGRKAWWLPPRKTIPVIEAVEVEIIDEGKRKTIPRRWKPTLAEY